MINRDDDDDDDDDTLTRSVTDGREKNGELRVF